MRGSLEQAVHKTGEKKGKLIRKVWKITLDTGAPIAGKRQRKFITIHGNKTAAEARLNEELSQHDKLRRSSPGNLTVADLLKEWLATKSDISGITLDKYQNVCRTYVIPALGAVKLKYLTSEQIQEFYQAGLQKLSNTTVHAHHRMLFQVFKYAVKRGYLARNVADREVVTPPSPKGKEMMFLKEFEVEILLKAAEGDIYYPVFYTALSTGMRRGELMALQWRDIDLPTMQITVSKTLEERTGHKAQFKIPKTKLSKRMIRMTPGLALYLGKYLEAQTDAFNKLGKPLTGDSMVFNDEGQFLNGCTVGHAFNRLTKVAGFNGLRFHDMRHTFALLMLNRGVNPLIVSRCLGHASVGFTLDTYGHCTTEMMTGAMEMLGSVLPAGVVNNGNK